MIAFPNHHHQTQVAYFGIFAFSVLFAGIVSLFVGLIPELACAMAAMKMHQKMLYGIIRAPMSFFDTTPTGRVLARFSGDIEDVESDLAPDLLGIVDCIFEVISQCCVSPSLVVIALGVYDSFKIYSLL